MAVRIVSITDKKYIKANVNVLAHDITYKFDEIDNFNINVITSANIIVPSIFEIELENGREYDQSEIIKMVVDTVGSISIKRYDLTTCPVCEMPINLINNHIICFNLDCCSTRDNIKIKMVSILPNLSLDKMTRMIDYIFDEFEVECTFNSVIEHILKHHKEYIDFFQMFAQQVVEQLKDIKLDGFFCTMFGITLPNGFDEVIKKYNNRLILMIEDKELDTIHNVSNHVRNICRLTIQSNKAFFVLIFKYISFSE